jgi:hypothetical protein
MTGSGKLHAPFRLPGARQHVSLTALYHCVLQCSVFFHVTPAVQKCYISEGHQYCCFLCCRCCPEDNNSLSHSRICVFFIVHRQSVVRVKVFSTCICDGDILRFLNLFMLHHLFRSFRHEYRCRFIKFVVFIVESIELNCSFLTDGNFDSDQIRENSY